MTAIADGTLPAVSFFKPIGARQRAPRLRRPLRAATHTLPTWSRRSRTARSGRTRAIIITYDENGGFWDHVAPPEVDRWGPGTRVPAIIISPFAKKGFVDHTQYDTTSILKLIETRWGLAPLGTRDRDAGDLTNAFDFGG